MCKPEEHQKEKRITFSFKVEPLLTKGITKSCLAKSPKIKEMRFELGLADEIPNTFNMWFTMQGNKEIHREYLVYDPLNFIGTVGGILELFVGFSFYDFLSIIIEYSFIR